MAYINTQDIVRKTGIGVEINNELVGTGDDSNKSFDLKNRHIIANTYTLFSAPASGEDVNDFTDLTETTDYALDKDSGRVLLTSSGLTALGTNKIYSKYIHSPKISDTILATYIPESDEEVNRSTGAFWGTPISRTEFTSGRKKFPYPKTDRPFNKDDYDEPDHIQLNRKNVTEVNEVSFLKRGTGFANVQSDDGGSFTDNTDESNSPGGTAFLVYASTPTTDDAIYFANSDKFHGILTDLFITGIGSPTVTWEYWNGSAWTSFSVTEETANSSIFTASGRFTWNKLSAWTKNSVNSSESLYFVRGRLTGSYSTSPEILHAIADQDSVIATEIPLFNIDFTTSGRITFINDRIPNGDRNVKVVFKHGQITTNPLIGELSALYAGLRVYANITGGSYDDETGITIGGVAVQIGEVWTNIRETVSQTQARINTILIQLGRRMRIAVA